MTLKKITLIYPFAYGYIDFVVQELQLNQDILITDIKTDSIKYIYPNKLVKLWNGITKLFGSNLKKKYFNQQILQQIKEKQDIIFIIRPDLLEISLLKILKENTDSFIAYYYDSCKKYPRQLDISSFFDEIYSYETEDIEKYNFLEASNFIYDETIQPQQIEYDIFNVSSYDSRIDEINDVSKILFDAGFKIYFVLFWFEKLIYPHLHSTTEYLSLNETKEIISRSKAMIDIQRKDQKGLSFRTFESLGYRKKLITTNTMVQNYDFYHPNNMLIIDSENINITEIKRFLELPYVEISQDIINKYNVKNFTKNIFKL
ncbi:hypothetical protein HZQ12_15485 [Elizabethkingia anophelis]|uniref:hypothetical protein n=1 Tax=Elizabethkingia anophelis TaxID=1117645 RepID=UPI0021A6DC20|nr:hypothetical protein [Elizabethkingia anophelis]MCT3978302.1 hypothetical protein [Elizabethkingia anophelis]MCT4042100.1 hypothetical protein [Elizabethkingia anophelis]